MAGVTQASELRLLLLGKTGCGKSATGNNILGEEKFFSCLSAESITQDCAKAEGFVRGRKVVIVDTPGYFDTVRTNSEVSNSIRKATNFFNPGFHAIILVVRLARLTPEEKQVVQEVKKLLHLRAKDYLILLFTFKDALKGKDLSTFLKTGDQELNDLINYCGGRYLAFNNESTQKPSEDVAELMAIIDKMVASKRSGNFCSLEMVKMLLDHCIIL